jgi:hypothetical protein
MSFAVAEATGEPVAEQGEGSDSFKRGRHLGKRQKAALLGVE